MANTLRFKRGLVSGIPTAALGEPLFTTDTFDLYIGNGTGNTRFQKYIASGTTSQLLRGDGSLLTMPIVLTSPSNGQVLKYDGTNWVNSSDAGVTGSGVTNYVSKWTSTGSIGNSQIFDNGTNVGIGTTAPAAPLSIKFPVSGNKHIEFVSAGGVNYIESLDRTSGNAPLIFYVAQASAYLGFTVGSTTERMRLHGTGNLVLGGTVSSDNGLRFQVTGDGYFSGSVGIGTTTSTNRSLVISKTMTGTNSAISILQNSIIASDVTVLAINNYSQFTTQAATFTLPHAYHYYNVDISVGAGSSITNQYAYFASNMGAATNNYGFYGNIASGTGRWNLYMNGTASNYLNGGLAIGTTSLSGYKLIVVGSTYLAGTTNYIDGLTIFRNSSAVETIRFFATNNVGIGTGTSDTGERLQVNGTMRVSGASTFNAGMTLTTGVQSIFTLASTDTNGRTWTLNTAGTTYYGSGAGSFVLRNNGVDALVFNASSAATFSSSVTAANLYSTGASNFATSSGNVGIGTSSPSQKLTVSAAAALVDIISTTSTQFNGLEFKNGGGSFYIGQDSSTGAFYGSTLPYAASLYVSGNYPMTFFTNGALRMTLSNTGNFGIGMTPSYKLDVTGEARVSNAISIGTTPDTNKPFKILKNINGTVGINFENTSTGASAFSAIQMGTDVSGGTAFTNLVYSSSGITATGVYQPSGTSLINTGSGGLNFLSVSQPIRFFTSTGNGTERVRIKNEGQVHFVPLAAAPTTSVQAGDVYYDSTLAKLRCYDGIQWQDLF